MEKPWVSFFVLIYSFVLVQPFLSLSLSFISSKKVMTLLTFVDRIVPEKEKHTRTESPSFTGYIECTALG